MKIDIILSFYITVTYLRQMSCDCGIPGVAAFARIVNFDTNRTQYPEGYELRYDCIEPHGLNLNGEEKRVCLKGLWNPTDIPICDIADPDDGMSEFQIQVFDSKGVFRILSNKFHNDWSLFGSQDSYVTNLRKANNFIFGSTNQSTNLWRIRFAQQYPVEFDHSFMFKMLFVMPFNANINNNNNNNNSYVENSSLNVEIESQFTSTNRTCHTRVEKDSVRILFTDFNPNSTIDNMLWENDTFYKIYMECRNDWQNRPFRWIRTSHLEYLTGLNISVRVNSLTPTELILTQLIVDVDCGYADIPINGNNSKHWMDTIYDCNAGALMGDKNISCQYNGRWAKPMQSVPRCCLAGQCESITNETESSINQSLTITLIIGCLSSAVLILIVILVVLIIRYRRRQKSHALDRTQSKKSSENDYEDIDLNEYTEYRTYDHLKQPEQYESVEYDQVDNPDTRYTPSYFNLYDTENYNNNSLNPDMYDDCKRMSIRVMMSQMDGRYVSMDKCDNYLEMSGKSSKKSSNNSVSDNNYI